MPIYDARLNDPFPGDHRFRVGDAQPFPMIPCVVVDAAGVRIPCVRRCNTETGHVERFRLKPGTRVFVMEGHRPVIDLEQHPAPLRIEELHDVPTTEDRLREIEAAYHHDPLPGLIGELVGAARKALDACRAAVTYDEAVRACGNDPDKMATYCTAEGDDLDRLYDQWVGKARAALAGSQTDPPPVPAEELPVNGAVFMPSPSTVDWSAWKQMLGRPGAENEIGPEYYQFGVPAELQKPDVGSHYSGADIALKAFAGKQSVRVTEIPDGYSAVESSGGTVRVPIPDGVLVKLTLGEQTFNIVDGTPDDPPADAPAIVEGRQ